MAKMGMFDWVVVVPPTKCRVCGRLLDGWQSKDGSCVLRDVPFWEVKNFYTACCDTWYEYTRVAETKATGLYENGQSDAYKLEIVFKLGYR